MKNYKYYSMERPVSLGTYPKEGYVSHDNYDRQTTHGWGEIEYSRSLTKSECEHYALRPEIRPAAKYYMTTEAGECIIGDEYIHAQGECGLVCYDAWTPNGIKVMVRDGDTLFRKEALMTLRKQHMLTDSVKVMLKEITTH